MSKKKKNKPKKVSAKKEKYAKFHKEKPGTLDISMPDLGEDGQKLVKANEMSMMKFGRSGRNPPPKEIVSRRAKSKR